MIRSLSEFVAEYVRPELKTVLWADPEVTLNRLGVDLKDLLPQEVQDFCAGTEWSPEDFELPGQFETLYLSYVEDVWDIDVIEVSELPSKQFWVRVKARLSSEFDVFMTKADWYIFDNPKLVLQDFDWNDHYVRAGITLELSCEVDVFIGPDLSRLEIISLEPVPEKY